MVAFDEETVLTGSSDGLIRVLSIQPNKMLGVLGEHSDFDIERIALKGDAMCLASISHDSSLKLWNTGLLLDDEEEEEDEVDKEEEEERSDSDSDDSDDGARGKGKRTADEGRRNKGAHKIPKKESQKEPVSNFFADLL
jgi:WD40 repeat protein